jgi:hypothetical protein
MIAPLSTAQVVQQKEAIARLIQSALEATDCGIYYPVDWVIEKIIANDMQAWADADITYLMITQIIVYPSGHRELNAFAAAGSGMARFHRPMLDALLHFAKIRRCDTIAGSGRIGWLRVNRDYPPGPASITYRQVKRV